LARDPESVARALPAWGRGEPEEAVRETLALSARDLHARSYTFWAWSGRTAGGDVAWALPVSAAQAAAFAPRGPAQALLRAPRAAGRRRPGRRPLGGQGGVLREPPGRAPGRGAPARGAPPRAPPRARPGPRRAEPLPAGAPIPLPPPGPGGGGGTAVGRLAA